MEDPSHKSAALDQESRLKLEPDVTILLHKKTRVPIMESLNESKDIINCY